MTAVRDPSDYKILCVDDEPNILSALKRMISLEGFQVVTADSGAQALALMAEQTFHVVISDMQMPAMTGVELLDQVRQKWPHTMRVLLTGNAEVGGAIAAINQGEIYRYLTKPWDDAELLGVIKSAIDLWEQARVRDAKLRSSYMMSIKAFSGLIDLRRPELLEHSRKVAHLSRKVAKHAGLDADHQQEVFIAGLLHDAGKIAFNDHILRTKYFELPLGDVKIYRKHAALGQMSLSFSEELSGVGQIVRSHHEYFDGTGFPDKLSGESIPVGARIVALVECYEELIEGEFTKEPSTPQQALRIIASNRGKLFCPIMTDHFLAVMQAG